MMMQDFLPYTPPNLTSQNITVSFGEFIDGGILLVVIAGVIPDGSLGTPDCRFIRQELGRAVLAFEPRAILVDLRQMDYRFGNALVDALEPLGTFPTAYLSRENKGLASLLGTRPNYFAGDQEAAARAFIIREYEMT
jgi:hypothetical protein